MSSMKFVEKLAALTEGKNKRELSRQAGLRDGAISDYLARMDRVPTVDTGIALARVLGVDLVWLFDESQDLPPRSPGSTLTSDQLVTALFERLKSHVLKMHDLLDEIEKIDWEGIADRAQHVGDQEELPRSVEMALHLYEAIIMARRFGVLALATHTQDELTMAKGVGDFPRDVEVGSNQMCIVKPLDDRLAGIRRRLDTNEKVRALLWAISRSNTVAWVDPDQAMYMLEDALARYNSEAAS